MVCGFCLCHFHFNCIMSTSIQPSTEDTLSSTLDQTLCQIILVLNLGSTSSTSDPRRTNWLPYGGMPYVYHARLWRSRRSWRRCRWPSHVSRKPNTFQMTTPQKSPNIGQSVVATKSRKKQGVEDSSFTYA